MTKEKLAIEVIKRLKTAYPRTDCTLEYDEAWKLLVSVRLAAQCTDARVNVVVVDLFKKYPSIEALADADVSDIEEIVRPCGLGKSKARDISACMRMLRDNFGGLVPDNMTDLLKQMCIRDSFYIHPPASLFAEPLLQNSHILYLALQHDLARYKRCSGIKLLHKVI